MKRSESSVLLATAVAVTLHLAGCAVSGGPGALGAVANADAETIRNYSRDLDALVRRQIERAGLGRKDGYVYTMDVAPLLLYAALRKDEALYRRILPTVSQLVMQDADASFQSGFVVWRRKKDQPPEVTGAMEQIWLARALWAGARAFNRPEDRTLALLVLDGYAKHAFEQQGLWMVRRYYSFASRTFINYSVLTGYNADFLKDVEHAAPGKALQGFSERSYAMLDRSRSASGLLYPVNEPEIGLAWPGVNGEVFGPKNIAPLEDSCYAAEGTVQGQPANARRVLDFAEDSRHRSDATGLYAYYNGETGAPVGDVPLSSTGFACLMRLAVGLNNGGDVRQLADGFISQLRMTVQLFDVQPTPLYVAGPMLIAALQLGAFAPPSGTVVQ